MFGTWSGPKIKMRVDVSLDLGIARIEGVKPPPECVFPKFRVREVEQGELLCRAGYPFLSEDYSPQWNREDQFEFTNLFPVPVFVNEALVSRFISDMEGRRRWIETSSPGLKGQSGGPLFDIHGNVCGMQVNTAHYPLGFKGKARNQVLNVGRAIHVSAIIEQLEKDNIPYLTEEDPHGR